MRSPSLSLLMAVDFLACFVVIDCMIALLLRSYLAKDVGFTEGMFWSTDVPAVVSWVCDSTTLSDFATTYAAPEVESSRGGLAMDEPSCSIGCPSFWPSLPRIERTWSPLTMFSCLYEVSFFILRFRRLLLPVMMNLATFSLSFGGGGGEPGVLCFGKDGRPPCRVAAREDFTTKPCLECWFRSELVATTGFIKVVDIDCCLKNDVVVRRSGGRPVELPAMTACCCLRR